MGKEQDKFKVFKETVARMIERTCEIYQDEVNRAKAEGILGPGDFSAAVHASLCDHIVRLIVQSKNPKSMTPELLGLTMNAVTMAVSEYLESEHSALENMDLDEELSNILRSRKDKEDK